jgi:5-methyltetrahydropteroyltriglutamate--homocysteine methyltransferase
VNSLDKLFPTQEVGSLAKPGWRIKSLGGEKITEADIREAMEWGARLKLEDLDRLARLLEEEDLAKKRKKIIEWSALYAIKLLEVAGLDIVFNGEQWRKEMYEHVIKNLGGFSFLGFIKSFDYRYFNKAACISKPCWIKPLYLEEFLFTKKHARKPIKIPFTGPYTLVDWSFNEYYEKALEKRICNLSQRRFDARKEFLFDLIKGVIRPEIKRLVEAGAKWIQLDEPAATTHPTKEEMSLFVEGFNETVKGIDCKFSLHNCYSNYELLAKYVPALKKCSQISLEFANRDDKRLGANGKTRVGYEILKLFEEYGFNGGYGLGVIDVHTNFIESPELVKDRILYGAKVIRDPERINPSTDCGLRTRSWEVSFAKLKNEVLGAELARQEFE